jgi:cardiolipin synthase
MDTAALSSILLSKGTLALTIVHFASAGAVTLHALLRKREVAAAIGWIGLAWLSPLFGPLLYFGFGINRVKRRAQRLRGPAPEGSLRPTRSKRGQPAEHSLLMAVEKITGLRAEPGRVAAIYHSGDEGYPAMLAAIDAAKESIAFATFIFRTDELGEKFIQALIRAHERGVAVRVLIDGFGGGFLRSAAYHRLRLGGVPAARYLHSLLPWKMPLLDLRLHKKILAIDGKIAFVGGLNIGGENLLATNPAEPVRDTHFRVEGQVVSQIVESFRDDWAFTTREVLSGSAWFKLDHDSEGMPSRAIESGPDQGIDQLVLVLLSAINGAKSSIRIATPYFLPDEQLITALQLAALRGVAVDLVMPAINNHRLMGWATRAHVRPLLKMGCRLWRSPPPFDHSKLMAVDDSWCLIGSANWDARSLRLNFELTVEFHDPDLARRIGRIIEDKCKEPITLAEIDSRWGIIKIRDAAARLLMPYI